MPWRRSSGRPRPGSPRECRTSRRAAGPVAAGGGEAVEAGKDVEGVGGGHDALQWLIACWETDWEPRRNSSPLDSWSPAAPDAGQDLTTAKTVAQVSVVSNAAGGEEERGTPIHRC